MFKNSVIVMIINLLSRILGLVREILIGSFFGATAITDSFFTATRISNFFTTILGEGSLGTVFIPIYNDRLIKEGEDSANNFVFVLINFITSLTITLSLLMIVFSKFVIKNIIGFKNIETINLASDLLKITSCYLIFIALSGILSSLLNSYKKFLISTSTAIVFNLTIIIGMILTRKSIGIYGLAISYLLSGFMQFIIQVPSFIKLVKIRNYKLSLKDKSLKKFLYLMIPTLIGIFAYQINEIVDTSFASLLDAGTISSINYASRIYLLPIGVFGISLSVVIFPSLTRAYAKNDINNIKTTINKGLNLLSFLIIPSSLGLFYYSNKIVTLIYGNGKFNSNSILITSEILKIYSIGLLFFSTIHLLTRSHYVFQDRKVPTISSIIAISTNIILDYLLYIPYKYIGLTSATVFAAIINFSILLISLNKRHIKINIFKYLIFLSKIIFFSIISLFISQLYNNSNKFSIFINILIFLIVYLLLVLFEIIIKKIKIKNYFN